MNNYNGYPSNSAGIFILFLSLIIGLGAQRIAHDPFSFTGNAAPTSGYSASYCM